jgi:arsenate reductase
MVATDFTLQIFAEIDIDSNRFAWNHPHRLSSMPRELAMSQVDVLDPVTRHHVEQAAGALHREFEGIFGQETIARYIVESTDLLAGNARVNVFVPVLVHRFARERLKALGQSQGVIAKDQPEVLFVCVHNAGRSQMAAGLVKLRSEGRIHVRSAGSAPGSEINPAVVEAMQEIGVDLSEEFPKPLTDEFVKGADVVITMGCGDACPIYPGKKYEDWELDDPAGQDLESVRRIRDEIDARVQNLVAELAPS